MKNTDLTLKQENVSVNVDDLNDINVVSILRGRNQPTQHQC